MFTIKIKKNSKTDSYPTEEIKLFEEVKGKKKKIYKSIFARCKEKEFHRLKNKEEGARWKITPCV